MQTCYNLNTVIRKGAPHSRPKQKRNAPTITLRRKAKRIAAASALL
nr:MAG TPA: hypothetical protein [Caudoviricetes sp.]